MRFQFKFKLSTNHLQTTSYRDDIYASLKGLLCKHLSEENFSIGMEIDFQKGNREALIDGKMKFLWFINDLYVYDAASRQLVFPRPEFSLTLTFNEATPVGYQLKTSIYRLVDAGFPLNVSVPTNPSWNIQLTSVERVRRLEDAPVNFHTCLLLVTPKSPIWLSPMPRLKNTEVEALSSADVTYVLENFIATSVGGYSYNIPPTVKVEIGEYFEAFGSREKLEINKCLFRLTTSDERLIQSILVDGLCNEIAFSQRGFGNVLLLDHVRR